MKNTYIIGHKNPDTDSICSALSYAYLKNEISEEKCFQAMRLGGISPETEFVLGYFGVDAPELLEDIYPRMSDIPLHTVKELDTKTSLKRAWEEMRTQSIVTMPIVDENKKLLGVITASDITYSDMNVYDNQILAKAKTPYKNIAETIEGDIVVGNPEHYVKTGKILVSAAQADVLKSLVEEGDVVIVSNREDSMEFAINAGAKLLIVCLYADVSERIMELAKENGCDIIRTPYDTFTTSRLISHSLPCGYYMTKVNKLITINHSELIEDVQETMTKSRFRYYPVVDNNGVFEGFASRRRLLDFDRTKVVLVDHNEPSQSVDGLDQGNIIEIIDHHKLGNPETMGPIYFRNQPVGCTATIITQIYEENGVEIPKSIAGLLVSAILSDTLMFRSPTCTPLDQATAEKLAKIAEIEIEPYAMDMFKAGSDLSGKTPEEICFQDFKKFSFGEVEFGVGQITSMSNDELAEVKAQVMPYLPTLAAEQGLDMVFLMMTNILEESSYVIMHGEPAAEVITEGFSAAVENNEAYLSGVVSRKKQMIPNLLTALKNLDN